MSALRWVMALALMSGCDAVGPIFTVRDAGPDATTDAPTLDAPGPPDAPIATPPVVVATLPLEGELDVDPGVVVRLTFDAPLRDEGTLGVTADARPVAATSRLEDDGRVLVVQPTVPLPASAAIRVRVEGATGESGLSMPLPYVLSFVAGDRVAPRIASSTPAQGELDVGARLETVVLRFDERMDPTRGEVSLTGGPGTLGARTWTDARTLRIEVSGLGHETAYALSPEGFVDLSGNALERTSYLDAGAIRFSTGPDRDAVRVIDSVPAEGQVNVSLRGTPEVALIMGEPIDVSAASATLSVGGETVTLPITLDAERRRLTLPVSGRLRPDAPHRIELSGVVDDAGNPLDGAAYLGDGALDFDTGADLTAPVVVYSSPVEADVASDHLLSTIRLVFDRGMTPIDVLSVDDGVAPFDAPVSWNLAGTIATLDVGGRIHTGRRHRIDVRAITDLFGQPLLPGHPYLGDGVLDFSTRPPTGEQCRDEATEAEATRLPSGALEWVFGPDDVALADGGAACPFPGASSTRSADAVVRYEKTSAAGSAGGRYLHVHAESVGPGERVALAVYRDVCTAPSGDAARLTCLYSRAAWDSYLDVGPGTFFVWAGQTGDSTLDGLTVRIDEVDAVPEGEGCSDPWDVTSPIHSRIGDEHVWDVPGNSWTSVDMEDEFPGDGATACEENQVQGTDFVIAFDKAADDTLLSVVVEAADDPFDELTVEVRTRCDPRGDGTPPLVCDTELRGGDGNPTEGPRRYTFAAPQGLLHVWVANVLQNSDALAARVRIEEHEDVPGSSCENAIPLGLGTTAVAPASRARIAPPSCFSPPPTSSGHGHLDDAITWYRVPSSVGVTTITADVPGGHLGDAGTLGSVGLLDAGSGIELGCTADASAVPLASFRGGTGDLCVAVRGGSAVRALTVRSAPYDGLRGEVTDLGIAPPLGPSGSEISLASDLWLAATPSALYLAIPSNVIIAPRSGGERAVQRAVPSSAIGNVGLAVGEALFSVDDTAAAGIPRVFRLADAGGAEDLIAWDDAFAWPADAVDVLAFDGASLLLVNDGPSALVVRRLDPETPSAPETLGTLAASDVEVIGLAADATWLYFAGRVGPAASAQRGVFRARRDALGMPERIGAVQVTSSLGGTALRPRIAMAVDDTTAARYLYVRDGAGDVQVIADPGGVADHLGAVCTLGTAFDSAMAYDAASRELFLLESETPGPERFVRVR